MKFKVKDEPAECPDSKCDYTIWTVIQIKPEYKEICEFTGQTKGCEHDDLFLSPEIARALAHDYCDFLNEKYIDKNINEEWGKIDREARIEYHLEQLSLLNYKDNLKWNEHGNGVKE
jgi:hypothetical protein